LPWYPGFVADLEWIVPSSYAMPFSILCLAAAIAFHGITSAQAQDAKNELVPEGAGEPIEPAPRVSVGRPVCRPVHLGTSKELTKILGTLHEGGARDFAFMGTGTVCGWP